MPHEPVGELGPLRIETRALAAIMPTPRPRKSATVNLVALVYELKPYVLPLLLPPGPLLALIVIGAGLLRHHRLVGRAILALGLVGVWLSCSEGAAQWLSRHVLHSPPALEADMLDKLRARRGEANIAVLVLGGGARSDVPEYDGPSLRPVSLERLRYGVWLARRVGIGRSARDLHFTEAALAERTAAEEYRLKLRWAEGRSRDTRENAAFSLALLKADGIKTVLLVTHDLHMPRALQAFQEAAQGQIEIIAAPVGLRRDAMSSFDDWCPSSEGFARVRYAVYEWLGQRAGH
jgi:uncharacterized SAM-binding protein YcdF (DUF218 family)